MAHTEHGITIVGLGPGAFGQLSLAAWEAIANTQALYLRTAVHPTVSELTRRGISFTSFDALYDQAATFADVYQEIAKRILAAGREQSVVYAVPGHPFVGETSVRMIMDQAQAEAIDVQVVPSMSALDAIYATLRIDPGNGLQVLDALDFQTEKYVPGTPALFLQVYSRFVASQLKLALLEVLDPELPVTLVRAAGVPGEEVLLHVPLHEIDKHDLVDHLTSLYIPAAQPVAAQAKPAAHPLDPLVDVMARLRSENGCPWDRKQTHTSLKRYLIEESYEVIDAIDEQDADALCEELGDVLLQIVFHAQLAQEAGSFTIDDIVETVTAKMVRRHPHVFGDVEANDVSTVLRNWDAIKKEEKSAQGKPEPESLLSGVPRHLPALMHAEEVQKKAARVGFEWADVTGAVEKVAEEARELQDAVNDSDPAGQSAELGDLLFAIVNVARYLHVEPEEALRATTAKFMRRFQHIEERAAAAGRKLADMTVAEMDAFWNEAKELEKAPRR